MVVLLVDGESVGCRVSEVRDRHDRQESGAVYNEQIR